MTILRSGGALHTDRNAGALGTHEGHTEGAFSTQGLLDLGHGLQRPVVGMNEVSEVLVPFFKIESEGFDFFCGVRRLFGKQPPP
jgi:hypothetical protein